MARTGYQADQGGRHYLTHPRGVTLTRAEKEWLGATVRTADGLVGQVWCLGRPTKRGDSGSLWVASKGEVFEVDIADLQIVES